MAIESTEPQNWRPVPPELDLISIATSLWKKRLLVFACIAASFILAVIYLHFATYSYTTTLKITPAQGGGGEGASARLGGLASLAGISLPKDQSVSAFQLYLEAIQSREVATRISADPVVMVGMFPGAWDSRAAQWREPSSTIGPVKNAIKGILGIPVYAWHKPNSTDVIEYIQLNLVVSENPKKPVVTLRIEHPNPDFAVKFLEAVNGSANEHARQRALVRTKGNIAYLSQQLERVSLLEHREALASALSEQEKQRMLANSGAPFAAEPVGRALISSRPTKPQPVVLLVMSLFFGGIVGVMFAFLSNIFLKKQTAD